MTVLMVIFSVIAFIFTIFFIGYLALDSLKEGDTRFALTMMFIIFMVVGIGISSIRW